jgi:hypothetical protein
MPNWMYQFLLLRASYFNSARDFTSCMSVLDRAESISDQRGDLEMKACILICKSQYALAQPTTQSLLVVQNSLSTLSSTCFPRTTSQTQPYNGVLNKHLHLQYFLLYIVYNMHVGNVKQAIERLSEVHHALDAKDDDESDEELNGYTTVSLHE